MEERIAKATAKFIRVSPRRARLVVDEIRNKPVNQARAILKFMPNKAARFTLKVLNSAVANAVNNFGMREERLYVYRAYVDEGPRLKRLLPRAFGRADIMTRRMSHITVVVREIEGV
ncbi:50S ribosomal protein L22 [Coprothermobacteraceae bacterium]|nr:50S ribosomal protein L22 [Coprothermobacteraceae bacterium]